MHTYDRNYFKIALPAALEGLFMILLASTDLIMVGALGALSIAAVSIFLQPRLILLCFSRSLASSVTLLVSKKAGAGDTKGTADIMKKSLTLCAIFMGLLHILFYIFLDDIFYLMGANDEYMAEAMAYGPIALAAVYVTSLTLILQAVQLGYGRTSVIMKTNVAGNIINVILNFILIFGIGPVPAMGVAGAAIGTVFATLFTLIATAAILRGDGFFAESSYVPDKDYFRQILPIFGSILSEQGSERAGMVIFSRMAAGLGPIPFAIHSVCMNICDIYWDFITGFGKASMVTAGQSCGRGSEEDWKAYKKSGMRLSFYMSCAVFVLTLIFRTEIFTIYSGDGIAPEAASIIMIFVAFVSFPEAYGVIGSSILRGSGSRCLLLLLRDTSAPDYDRPLPLRLRPRPHRRMDGTRPRPDDPRHLRKLFHEETQSPRLGQDPRRYGLIWHSIYAHFMGVFSFFML